MINLRSPVCILALAWLSAACAGETQKDGKTPPSSAMVAPEIKRNSEKEAYFGDLHLHTAYSTDAVLLNNTTVTPDQAYQYARGESVTVLGKTIKIGRPMDFLAVTDHAELMGGGFDLFDPSTDAGKSEFGQAVRKAGHPDSKFLRSIFTSKSPAPGVNWDGIVRSTWQKQIDAAQKYNQPGRFTTFIGFEWSATPGFNNLHRNVIFASDKVALPYGANDSERPEDLWTYMERNRQNGVESLAIPHNGNLSNGLMYAYVDSDKQKIDKIYAERRALNEPLNEIVQTKGQSETHPSLSPKDPFANFEVFDQSFGGDGRKASPDGSYIRQAIGRGLAISEDVGANPYKTGFVGASDLHSGLTSDDETTYRGMHGAADELSKQQLEAIVGAGRDDAIIQTMISSSPGLAGVWAEANTRDALFDSMRRRETFATSGTRMKVRFFAGWNYDQAMVDFMNWKAAYASGVPMGSELSPIAAHSKAPQFIAWALKDPQGANLDRLQIVKVWVENSQPKERVFDVALSGGRKIDAKTFRGALVGSTVDLKTGSYKNTIGATQLGAVWRDPTFKPEQAAAYYVRALEIPTPRWTTLIANQIGAPLPKRVAAAIQERAWSSPIWYTPQGVK